MSEQKELIYAFDDKESAEIVIAVKQCAAIMSKLTIAQMGCALKYMIQHYEKSIGGKLSYVEVYTDDNGNN